MVLINSNFGNIGHVTVNSWKEAPKQEDRNDCYWNIAANSYSKHPANSSSLKQE